MKRLREGKKPKLSQEKLAFEADLDRTYISAVERRKRNIKISVLARLAKALKVRPAELVEPPLTGGLVISEFKNRPAHHGPAATPPEPP